MWLFGLCNRAMFSEPHNWNSSYGSNFKLYATTLKQDFTPRDLNEAGIWAGLHHRGTWRRTLTILWISFCTLLPVQNAIAYGFHILAPQSYSCPLNCVLVCSTTVSWGHPCVWFSFLIYKISRCTIRNYLLIQTMDHAKFWKLKF